ncbi:MAG: hypothetical protein IKK34_06820 [Clostridia bacterium]|nr:hypothetical protein [Clostridia bacterium]
MNPMAMVMQMMRTRNGNPAPLLEQLARQNPAMRQAMDMARGKSPQELRQIADNMARQRGTTVDNIIKQMGF